MGDDVVDQGPNNVIDVVTWTTLFLFAFFYLIIEMFYHWGDNFFYAFAMFLIYSIISFCRFLNQFELDRLNVINTSVILTFFISAIILMPVDGFPPTGVLCIPVLGPILVVMTLTFAKEEWSQTERKYFLQGSLLSLPFSITSLLLSWEMTDYVSIFWIPIARVIFGLIISKPIVFMGHVLNEGVIEGSQNDGAVAKAMLGTGKFEAWVKGIVLTRVVMLLNSEIPVIAYVTRMKIPWKKRSEWLIQ